MRKQVKFLSGFTLIEMMVTIAIMAVVATMVIPTSLNQQTLSINYANISLQQAKSYINMIDDNYTNYYTLAKSSPQSIPYSTVVANGYNGAASATDIYGATPCATIQYNTSSNKLEMFMYYVGGSNIQKNVIAAATNYLHGIAGQLNGSTFGSMYNAPFNIWSIPLQNIVGSCGSPQSGSMAINLKLLTMQMSQMQSDASLHRVPDLSGTGIGSNTNTNTMQTDLIMSYKDAINNTSYNGIYFTENNSPTSYPYLTSGANSKLVSPYNTGTANDIVTANSGLVANAFLPTQLVAPWTLCSSNELGKIVRDSTPRSSNIPVSDLQCKYDTVNCASPYYCYLPMNNYSFVWIDPPVTPTFSCNDIGFVDLRVAPIFTPPRSVPSSGQDFITHANLPTSPCAEVRIGVPAWIQTNDSLGRILDITGFSNFMFIGNGDCNNTIHAVLDQIGSVACIKVATVVGTSSPVNPPTPTPPITDSFPSGGWRQSCDLSKSSYDGVTLNAYCAVCVAWHHSRIPGQQPTCLHDWLMITATASPNGSCELKDLTKKLICN